MHRAHASLLLTLVCALSLEAFPITGSSPVRGDESSAAKPDGDRGTKRTSTPDIAGAAIGPEKGALLLCSVSTSDVRARFVTLAGGAGARLVIVLNRIPDGADLAAMRASAARGWGVRHLTVWHAGDRKAAESEPFLAELRAATGVWFTGGRPSLYADAFVGSAAQAEFRGVLERGGVIGGESAGATIQATHFVLPPSPQQAPVPAEGFGFVRGVTVFPHLAGESGKFPLSFCRKFVAAHPGLLGLGINDGAGVVLRARDAEVIGTGLVTVIQPEAGGEPSMTQYQSGQRFKLCSESPTESGKRQQGEHRS